MPSLDLSNDVEFEPLELVEKCQASLSFEARTSSFRSCKCACHFGDRIDIQVVLAVSLHVCMLLLHRFDGVYGSPE